MKNLFLLGLVILSIPTFLSAQNIDASVEKSTYGIQTGLLGLWVHNESQIFNSVAIRLEVGLDGGLQKSYANSDSFIMIPVFTLEPRWYYNLNRRVEKSKRIDGNSGNFISIKTSYRPDLFVIGGDDRVALIPDLQIVPTYGLRRNIGDHFNYEAGFGIGYIKYFVPKNTIILGSLSDVAVNLHLRIGYRF